MFQPSSPFPGAEFVPSTDDSTVTVGMRDQQVPAGPRICRVVRIVRQVALRERGDIGQRDRHYGLYSEVALALECLVARSAESGILVGLLAVLVQTRKGQACRCRRRLG